MSSKSLHVLFDDDDNLLDAVKEIVKNKIYVKYVRPNQINIEECF